MRIRATVVAVTGALTLSALGMPAALAAGDDNVSPAKAQAQLQELRRAASGKVAFTGEDTGTPYPLDVSFSRVKVNNGKPIVAGTDNKVSAPVSYRVTHAANVDLAADDTFVDVLIYRGDLATTLDNLLEGEQWPSCTVVSDTVADCKGTIDILPGDDLFNEDATSWKAFGYVIDFNDEVPFGDNVNFDNVGYTEQDKVATTKLQRFSKLTVNAAPEPVKKGKTITVTGKLSRANWDTGKYAGYATQSVKLQFRKKGSSTYTTVKTIKTSSTGALKTTVKATADGYFRYSFAGTSTTPAVSAAGDFVDVK